MSPPEEPCGPDGALRQDEGDQELTRTMAPAQASRTVIGRYRLLQKVGEGGMGEVWLAEQQESVRRRVALKLIKAGLNSREVIARFESERQALALMNHPAIAKVLDAGTTPEGGPYFVMEYVAGVPITTYCDNRRLSTPERLDLFIQVCEGVHHAHQKAIIHRDLKPSNILVAEVDGRAAPKIIDFGVAKALTQKLTADTVFTRVGALVGTPEYMSPEQAASSGEDIDTRTDVYSLGILFYELLAGVPPLDMRKITFEEFLRKLREDDPPKPSTRMRTQNRETASELARKRQMDAPALAKQIRGDLDCIALKALEKDRSRRYGSASEFAADIGRYLKHEAVLAVPASAAYRASKFARRHRGALITACAFALVLTAATVVSIRQSIRANREAAVSQAVNDFLQNDLLAQADVGRQMGVNRKPNPDLKVRTVLDQAAARIAGKFGGQPEVEASIRETIGQAYYSLGVYPEARKQHERVLELRRRVLGMEHPKTLSAALDLGQVAFYQGNYAEAKAVLNQTLELQRRVLGPAHPDTLRCMQSLANLYYYEGEYAQAEAIGSQTLEMQRRVLGPEHPATLGSMTSLGATYVEQGKYAQAETLGRQALEIERRVLGPEHSQTLLTLLNLAIAHGEQGHFAEAEALFRQNLEIRRRLWGPEHAETLRSMSNLAVVSVQQGKYAQAEALLSETLEIQRRVTGPEHPWTLLTMQNLSGVYSLEGRHQESETLFRKTLEVQGRVLGAEHRDRLFTMSSLAFAYYLQGRYAEAEAFYTQALTGRRHTLEADNPYTLDAVAELALVDQLQGKFAASEKLAREAVEAGRRKRPDTWQRGFAESLLGASLSAQKKYAEAEPLLLEGYRGMEASKERISVPDRYHQDLGRGWIVQLYQALGDPRKAAEWKKK